MRGGTRTGQKGKFGISNECTSYTHIRPNVLELGGGGKPTGMNRPLVLSLTLLMKRPLANHLSLLTFNRARAYSSNSSRLNSNDGTSRYMSAPDDDDDDDDELPSARLLLAS